MGRVRYRSGRVPRGSGPSGRFRRSYRRVLGLWAKVTSGWRVHGSIGPERRQGQHGAVAWDAHRAIHKRLM